jgi:hypothetical protein
MYMLNGCRKVQRSVWSVYFYGCDVMWCTMYVGIVGIIIL